MKYDKKVDVDKLNNQFSTIASLARTKTDTSGSLKHTEIADRIREIKVAYKAPRLYECVSVDTETKTWVGYGLKRDYCYSKYTYTTSGLTYTDIVPVVGDVYTEDASLHVVSYYKCIEYDEYGNPIGDAPGQSYESSDFYIRPTYDYSTDEPQPVIVSIEVHGNPDISGLEYSTSKHSKWRPWKPEYKIKVTQNNTLYIRNTKSTLSTSSSDYIKFHFDGKAYVGGRISSLVNKSNDYTPYCFYKLFEGCDLDVDTSLFGTECTTSDWCFAYMFAETTSIYGAPMPSTTYVAKHAYDHMFYKSSVERYTYNNTWRPEVLDEYACSYMFAYTNIGSYDGGAVSATDCRAYACDHMFYGCSKLTYGGVLQDTQSIGDYCFQYAWANCPNVASNYMGNGNHDTALGIGCFSHAFENCTALTSAYIYYKNLVSRCFEYMFNGCSNINSMYVFFEKFGDATTNWLAGVSPTGKFNRYYEYSYDYENGVDTSKRTEIKWGDSYIPDGWEVNPTPTLTTNSYISKQYSGFSDTMHVEYKLSVTSEDESAEFIYRKSEYSGSTFTVAEDGTITGVLNNGDRIDVYVECIDQAHGYAYGVYIDFSYTKLAADHPTK